VVWLVAGAVGAKTGDGTIGGEACTGAGEDVGCGVGCGAGT
jgi:hypothetical protein